MRRVPGGTAAGSGRADNRYCAGARDRWRVTGDERQRPGRLPVLHVRALAASAGAVAGYPGCLDLDRAPGRVVHFGHGQPEPVPQAAQPFGAGPGDRLFQVPPGDEVGRAGGWTGLSCGARLAGELGLGAFVSAGTGALRSPCWSLPGCGGLPVADLAGPPSRLVPPSRAAGRVTTRGGLQDTHRRPTGTRLIPAACRNSPLGTPPAAQAAGRGPPVIDHRRCRVPPEAAASRGGSGRQERRSGRLCVATRRGSGRWQARGCGRGSAAERGGGPGLRLAGGVLQQLRARVRLTR